MYHFRQPALVLRLGTGPVLELPLRPDIAEDLLERAADAVAELGVERLGEECAYALLGRLISIGNAQRYPPSVAQINFALGIAH